ncbi:hypothetical protein P3T21_004456 [Paraburkholderia sp. GAS334]
MLAFGARQSDSAGFAIFFRQLLLVHVMGRILRMPRAASARLSRSVLQVVAASGFREIGGVCEILLDRYLRLGARPRSQSPKAH